MQEFQETETFEDLIDLSVDKYNPVPLPKNMKLSPDNADQYLRVRETVEQEASFRKAFFRSWFSRNPQWRITALVFPHQGRGDGKGNVIAYLAATPWPLVDAQVLQAISDMKQLGWFTGDGRSSEQIEQDRKEARALAILADAKEREQLVQKLIDARPKNDFKLTRMSDAAYAVSTEACRKQFQTYTTESLRMHVANLEKGHGVRNDSQAAHTALIGSARTEQGQGRSLAEIQYGASKQTVVSAERECPVWALPEEFTASRLKAMPAKEYRALINYPNGQSRPVAQGSTYLVSQAVSDRLAGRS